MTLRPIAGTRQRGRDAAEDARLEAELRADPKERAEHVMLVDLGRNDVGRVAAVGTRARHRAQDRRALLARHAPRLGGARAGSPTGLSAVDVLRAGFPAGTVSGAPKVRAMEIIDELEPARRGPYAGAVGYFDRGGDMDMCIAIRTLMADGRRVSVAGGRRDRRRLEARPPSTRRPSTRRARSSPRSRRRRRGCSTRRPRWSRPEPASGDGPRRPPRRPAPAAREGAGRDRAPPAGRQLRLVHLQPRPVPRRARGRRRGLPERRDRRRRDPRARAGRPRALARALHAERGGRDARGDPRRSAATCRCWASASATRPSARPTAAR